MANTQKTILALLVGTAIGAGVGLLYAPNSGEETRRRMGKSTREAQDKANKKIKKTTNSVASGASRVLSNLESRVDETLSSVSMKADGVLESMEHKLEELRRQNKKFQNDSMADIESGMASNGTSTAKPMASTGSAKKAPSVADTAGSSTVASTNKKSS